ncbi:MAG: hypothetical protein J6M18_04870 [Actinomycetaceae bacterium]|nr:hypothetical protein [Actinomycetaceae bacterium]
MAGFASVVIVLAGIGVTSNVSADEMYDIGVSDTETSLETQVVELNTLLDASSYITANS